MKLIFTIQLVLLTSLGYSQSILNSLKINSFIQLPDQSQTKMTKVVYTDNQGNLLAGSIYGVVGSLFITTVKALYNYNTSNLPDSVTAYVSGYNSINDGGGGVFYYSSKSTSLDDGGTILKSTKTGRWIRMFNGSLNAQWFGAIGNNSFDNSIVFNKLFAASKTLGKDIYIPSGIFKIISTINWDLTQLNGISLYGEGTTTQLVTSSANTMLFISSNFVSNNISIHNIFFNNLHSIVTTPSSAFFIQGGPGEWFKNVNIYDCRFEGFSSAIGFQGVIGVNIIHNTFAAPLGHDNAQNNDDPANFIVFSDNSNGYVQDVVVSHNWASGYTGSDITTTTTKRPMDNFVYGTAYGYNMFDNTTINFCQEHYAIAVPITFPYLNRIVKIHDNYLDCSIPIGSSLHSSALLSNYGIRCDQSNVHITNNDFYNFTIGILVYPFQSVPTMRQHSIDIVGNHLYAPRDATNYTVTIGIMIQGSKSVYNCNVSDNYIDLDSTKTNGFNGILLNKVDSSSVLNNNIRVGKITNTGSSFGIVYTSDTTITDANNTVIGLTKYNTTNSSL